MPTGVLPPVVVRELDVHGPGDDISGTSIQHCLCVELEGTGVSTHFPTPAEGSGSLELGTGESGDFIEAGAPARMVLLCPVPLIARQIESREPWWSQSFAKLTASSM